MTKPATQGHNQDTANIIKRWLSLLSEQDDVAASIKDLKEECKGKGFTKHEMKAMALVIREHRNPVDKIVKEKANQFFADSDGQYTIFAE